MKLSKAKFLILITFALQTLYGCGNSKKTANGGGAGQSAEIGSSTNPQVEAALQGRWRSEKTEGSGCSAMEVGFAGGNSELAFIVYLGKTCVPPIKYSAQYTGRYRIGPSEAAAINRVEYDLLFSAMGVTFNTDSLIVDANQKKLCGHANWQSNQEKIVTSGCREVKSFGELIEKLGNISYSVIEFNGNAIKLGDCSTEDKSRGCDSSGSRPIQLGEAMTRVQGRTLE